MSVRIESYKSNSFACQRFSHSTLHYGYAPRRVKCAGLHFAKNYSETKEKDPKFTNCEVAHTANYSKCLTLIREKSIHRPSRQNTLTSLSTSTPIPTLEIHTPILNFDQFKPSYASIIATTSPDIRTISVYLVALIPLIESGEAKVKGALFMILSILTLLLNQQ